MHIRTLENTALAVSGITAVAIGAAILTSPHGFYASYGITLGPDPSLLSELRAPAAGLAALGGVMLAGIWNAGLRSAAIAAALIVFLAFPAGRLMGLVVDGVPSGSILGALAIEIVIAALCLFAFRRHLTRNQIRKVAL